MKATLVWNGKDFGFAGSEELVPSIAIGFRRYASLITGPSVLWRMPTKKERDDCFKGVIDQLINYIAANGINIIAPAEVTCFKISMSTKTGLPKFSFVAQGGWISQEVCEFKIKDGKGDLLPALLREMNIKPRECKEDVLQQTPVPKHGSAADATMLDERKPDISIKAKIDDSIGSLLSDSFKRLST